MESNWTKKELLAYLLIYCMRADCVETDSEVNFIKSRVGEDIYKKAYAEFSKDNDFISVNKVRSSYKALNLKLSEKEELIHDMKELFRIDGQFDDIEQGIQMTLKRILQTK